MSAFSAAADSTIDVDKVPLCPAGFRIAAIDTARNSAAAFNPDRVAGNTGRNGTASGKTARITGNTVPNSLK